MSIVYDFDQVFDRRDSDSIKWNYYDPDVLPMWVADMDFRSPEPVIQALKQRVEHGIFGYPDVFTHKTQLVQQLYETLVARMATLYNWVIQPDDILFLPGVVNGFNLACHAFAGPEGAVLVQTPVYHPILHAAEETGCFGQEMELTHNPDGSYNIDSNLFIEKITPQTRLFILCNPHNPVGKVFRRDELETMAEICLKRGILICSDEIHCDLVFSGHPHTPIAAIAPEIAQNTITLMAPSKTFNIAGLQCSFAIVQNPLLRQHLMKSTKGLFSWVNLMGLQAALEAYREGAEWLSQLLQYLEGNRDYLIQFGRDFLPEIKMCAPQGTYLAWLDCRALPITSNPYQFFLEKARVGFNDGEIFGRGGKGFVRLNFGCPRATLKIGLERMKQALDSLK